MASYARRRGAHNGFTRGMAFLNPFETFVKIVFSAHFATPVRIGLSVNQVDFLLQRKVDGLGLFDQVVDYNFRRRFCGI